MVSALVQIGDDRGCLERRIDRPQRLRKCRPDSPVVMAIDADDDAVGREEVGDGYRLARELRVVGDAHRRVDLAGRGSDVDGRARHQRGADDDHAR